MGGKGFKYRCVVKIGFQKTSLYRKRVGKTENNNNNNNDGVPGPAGGSKKSGSSRHGRPSTKSCGNKNIERYVYTYRDTIFKYLL